MTRSKIPDSSQSAYSSRNNEQIMAFFRHGSSIEKLRRGLRSHPPRPMHAHLPLDTQLLVATFTLQLRFTLEGVGQDLPATSTPTIELPLRTLLQPTTTRKKNRIRRTMMYSQSIVRIIWSTELSTWYDLRHSRSPAPLVIRRNAVLLCASRSERSKPDLYS